MGIENAAVSLPGQFHSVNKESDLDPIYGPYDSTALALVELAKYGKDGRKVGVYTDKPNGVVKLYIYNQNKHTLEGITRDSDMVKSSEIPSGSALAITSSENIYYFSGASNKNVVLPNPISSTGKKVVIINKGTAIVRAHTFDDSPTLLILNKLDYSNQALIQPNNIGRFVCDGISWSFETVNNFETIAEEDKTVVMTVLPDGTPQAEEIMELWVYDDTLTGYDLAGLQTAYPTSSGYLQGFEVRCRLMTPPTTYRKESENDSRWIKIVGENVI